MSRAITPAGLADGAPVVPGREVPDGIRVVVIGGGAGGLAAAHALRAAGCSVTVLERESRLGGKCRTVRTETALGPLDCEMGAGLFQPSTNPRVIALAREMGITTETWTPPLRYRDRATGAMTSPPSPSPASVGRYLAAGFQHRHLSHRDGGFAGTSPELATPFSRWATDRGMADLAEVFAGLTTSFGYGYLDEVPAAYVLKYIDLVSMLRAQVPAALWNRVRPSWSPIPEGPRYQRLVEGFGGLMTQAAARVPDVRTDVEVTSVRRGDSVEVEYVDADGRALSLEADALVLACPLDLPSLPFLDASAQEADLLGRVRWVPYHAALCRASSPHDGVCAAVLDRGRLRPPEDGEPVLAIRAPGRQTGEICAVYTMARPGAVPSAPLAERVGQGAATLGIDVQEIIATAEWRYFPHVGEADFRAGFYDEMEALQGTNRTYYVGGLLSFETVERTIAFARRIARVAATQFAA